MDPIILISPPDVYPDEISIVEQLVTKGLSHYHFRKPEWDSASNEVYLDQWSDAVRNIIVMHNHIDLVNKYQLHGFHLNHTNRQEIDRHQFFHKSYSAHTFEEIANLESDWGYATISPIYDSISKPGYQSNFTENKIFTGLKKASVPVVALGGVSPANVEKTIDIGFNGIALLGGIWGELDEGNPLSRYDAIRKIIATHRPKVLSIAGYDPSGGAGVLADIKTFESHQVMGYAVNTANTIQNSIEFKDIDWVQKSTILQQIDIIASESPIRYVKVGLIENLTVLQAVINHLRGINSGMTIVWDPIIKSSSGKLFHTEKSDNQIKKIVDMIDLITPNSLEFEQWFENYVDGSTAILVKGGHNLNGDTTDILYQPNNQTNIKGIRLPSDKHGTGCVLSASILSHLAKGIELIAACQKAKQYTERYIRSHTGRLGYHV